MSRCWTVVIAAMLLSCAASEGDDREVASSLQPVIAEPASVSLESVGVTLSGADEQRAKRAVTEPIAPAEELVDSQSAIVPGLGFAAVAAELRGPLEASTVPVLLPSVPELLRSGHAARGVDWYTVWLRGDRYDVGVFGTRRPVHGPSLRPAAGLAITADQPLITISEGVPSISFVRFGAAYRLELECDAGPSDEACSSIEVLRELYDALVLVGDVP